VSERVPRVGVLALQGDFAAHQATLAALGVEPVRVSRPEDLEHLDALVMPGGESTTMLRLIEVMGLRAPLERFVASQPVLGTCAGLILLARGADALPHPTLGVLDADVARNAYGRQIDSFTDTLRIPPVGGEFPGVFIRAPRIVRAGAGTEPIAWHGGEVVGVRQGRLVGICFHPELTQDLRFHRWFLEHVAQLTLPAAVAAPPAEPAREDAA
jgi:5'-phosphate synthase pdxT subunit